MPIRPRPSIHRMLLVAHLAVITPLAVHAVESPYAGPVKRPLEHARWVSTLGSATYDLEASELFWDDVDWTVTATTRRVFAADPFSDTAAWGVHWGVGAAYFGFGESTGGLDFTVHQLTARYYVGFFRSLGEKSKIDITPFFGIGAAYWDASSAILDESDIEVVFDAGLEAAWWSAIAEDTHLGLGVEYNFRIWDLQDQDIDHHLLTPFLALGYRF